jgi:hypothetical protein
LDKVPVVTDPDPDDGDDDGDDGGTDTGTKTQVSDSSINLPLIIGCVVGGVGFLAISGFMIYYIIKVKKRSAMKD